MRAPWLVAATLLLALPAAAAAPVPSYNCSPGFGGGLFCWVWAGNGCEMEAYVPPNPVFPGPGDPLPYVHAYACGPATCYTDVEQGGEQCVITLSETCSVRVRSGALPDDDAFGEAMPSADAGSCLR